MLNDKAPGCFGYAVTHDVKSDTCKFCKWEKTCADRAHDSLLLIQKEMNVDDLLSRYSREDQRKKKKPKTTGTKKRSIGRKKKKINELTNDQIGLLTVMPKKVGAVASQLFKKGIDLQLELSSKINPFEHHKPAFLQVPCRMLIERDFTKKSLKAEFLNIFPEWAETTAESHVSISCALLTGMNIVEVNEGIYKLRKL